MRVSLFRLGLALMIVGTVWISLVFMEAEKTHDVIFLKQSSSFELKTELVGTGVGFYKVYMPEFVGEKIFVQILDAKDNIIQEQMIQTKMSVGYFDFGEDGTYTGKITNVSKNPIELHVEFGGTNSQEMIPGGILVLVSALTIMMISYLKLKNYSIEQPDENIS